MDDADVVDVRLDICLSIAAAIEAMGAQKWGTRTKRRYAARMDHKVSCVRSGTPNGLLEAEGERGLAGS